MSAYTISIISLKSDLKGLMWTPGYSGTLVFPTFIVLTVRSVGKIQSASGPYQF